MVQVPGKGKLHRIQDFVALANEGEKVKVTIDLREEFVSQRVHPHDTEELKSERDMYLLFGQYTFKVDKRQETVSKVYMYGFAGEPPNYTKINRNIANARLKMDYQRLRDANIHFEEKYF